MANQKNMRRYTHQLTDEDIVMLTQIAQSLHGTSDKTISLTLRMLVRAAYETAVAEQIIRDPIVDARYYQRQKARLGGRLHIAPTTAE